MLVFVPLQKAHQLIAARLFIFKDPDPQHSLTLFCNLIMKLLQITIFSIEKILRHSVYILAEGYLKRCLGTTETA